LKELWSDRLFKILIANPPQRHFGEEVVHCDIKGLCSDPGDLDTLYPNIEEHMEFIKVLIVKQKLEENFRVRELNCIALFGPLKQIIPDINKFYSLHTCRKSHGEQFLFW
jgi:hypothetical protein